MALITKYQPLDLRYTPWRASGDPSSKEINEASFIGWYHKMLEVIKAIKRVPNFLLDDYSLYIWFNINHGHLSIQTKCVHLDTFQMRAQKFMLTEEAFHMEVNSWWGMVGEVQ